MSRGLQVKLRHSLPHAPPRPLQIPQSGAAPADKKRSRKQKHMGRTSSPLQVQIAETPQSPDREDPESRSPNLGPCTTKGTLWEPPLRDLHLPPKTPN